MATYVNDLRLKEIATGDEAGTWGTSTNTNLELIGEALGYGTQDCFSSDADATTTVADGTTDPARAMYFKVTSSATLTATRTLTIAPNTISRVMFIENATTGSQSITISQGTGANVTIATGKTAVVYLDGAGSGAAVVDAMALVDPGITDTLAEVLVAGNTTGGTSLVVSSGDDVTFTGASANIVFDSSDSALEFADNAKAIFGAGSDLQIYHNASNSYIDDAGTGGLVIRSSQVNIGKYTGETAAVFTADGSVQLRYDNSAKFETTATGIDVTGVITTDGMTTSADINVADNVSIRFGDATNGDLVIKHDGTNSSIVDRGDGDLLIQGSTNVKLQNFTGSKDYFVGSNGGASTVYHDGSARLATTATGINVTGTAVTDGLTVDGNTTNLNYGKTFFTNGLGTNKWQIWNDNGGTDKFQLVDGDGHLVLQAEQSGDISFFEDTGTTAKLVYDASAEVLEVNKLSALGDQNTKLDLNIANTARIFTGGLERLRVDSSGQVGIGTSSPDTHLHVQGSSGEIRVQDTGSGGGIVSFRDSGTSSIPSIQSSGNNLLVNTGGSERLRIDASGNLLVGTTDSDPSNNSANSSADNGIASLASGEFVSAAYKASANAGSVGYFNRTGTDGAVLEFRKSGSAVGSIGVTSGNDLVIDGTNSSTDTGLK